MKKRTIFLIILSFVLMVTVRMTAATALAGAESEAPTVTYLEDDFESYPEGSSPALAEPYISTSAAFSIVESGDHGKVLQVTATSANPGLKIEVGKVEKEVQFDFCMADTGGFTDYGGLFAQIYINGANELYTVMSPPLEGGTFRISSSVAAEAGGISGSKGGFSVTNGAWYTYKARLVGSTLSVKWWEAGTVEPDWMYSAATALAMTDTNSTLGLGFVNVGASSTTVKIDNLSIKTYADPLPDECTVTVGTQDAMRGTVSGGGTYNSGAEITVTATANTGYVFDCWKRGSVTVSTSAAYTYTVTGTLNLTAVFKTANDEPEYTYLADDYDGYSIGEANKDTMSSKYVSFPTLGDYRIVDDGTGNQVLQGITSSQPNQNNLFIDCNIIDKQVSFDFRYNGNFISYGGLYITLHSQPNSLNPSGYDQYYFSVNPTYTSNLIISRNEDNLGNVNMSFSGDTWYSCKSRLVDGKIWIKIWQKGTAEPAAWTFSHELSGFEMVSEDATFVIGLFNVSSPQVTVQFDNLSIKTWAPLPTKQEFFISALSSDTAKGAISGSGRYLDGNLVTLTATPTEGYSFVSWTDKDGAVVSDSAIYKFPATSNLVLTANFEETPVMIRSFMAAGLTQVADIDRVNKTVTLRFASDTDLSQVNPYFYLDAGVDTDETPYEVMDLSSGPATIGEGDQMWTIYATKNSVMMEFYVNGTTGSDSNSGTSASGAFKTLERAQEVIRTITGWSGDVIVHIAAGEYILDDTLEFTTADSADKGYAVIWDGGNPNDVSITSGIHLDGGWTSSSDVTGLGSGLTAWEYDASGIDYSRDLYVDGELATLAIYVLDEGAIGSWAFTDVPMLNKTGTGYTATGVLDDMFGWRNPTDIEFVYEVGWTYSILPITSITDNGSSSTVTMKADAYYAANRKGGINIQDPNYIQNCFEGLDTDGEWYFDRAAEKIYYITDGDNPNNMNMILPTLDQLITVNGKSAAEGGSAEWVYGLTLKNIKFEYTSYLRPHTEGQVEVQASYIVNLDAVNWLNWMTHDFVLKTDGGITASYTEGMRVQNCIFTNMSASALDFEEGCRGSQFVQNNVTNICANGLTVSGVAVRDAQPYSEFTYEDGVLVNAGTDPDRVTEYTLVMSNLFDGIGLRYTGSVGIFAGFTRDITIAHNTITNASYSGISCGWGWGFWDQGGRSDQTRATGNPYGDYYTFTTPSIQARYVIENNDISYVCQRLADGGAVYTLSNMPGSKLNNNYVHDCHVIFGGYYFDEASGGFTEMKNNILYSVHTIYNYHLVGGFTDRQSAMGALFNGSNNYQNIKPTDAGADATYLSVMNSAGFLDELPPPPILSNAMLAVIRMADTIEATDFDVLSSDANTQSNVLDHVEDRVSQITGSGSFTFDYNVTGFTAAVDGDEGEPDGTGGSMTFTATVLDGTNSHSTSSITVTINASAYTAPGKTPAEAGVEAVEGLVFDAVRQADANTIAELRNVLYSTIDDALSGLDIITWSFQDVSFTPAAAGTRSDTDGTGGIYTFKIAITDEDGTETTGVLRVDITATAFDPQKAVDNFAGTIEGMSFTVNASDANTQEGVLSKVKDRVLGLEGAGNFTVSYEVIRFTPAIAGTQSDRDGTDGIFIVKIAVSDGEYSHTTGDITVTVKAAAYSAPADNAPGTGDGTNVTLVVCAAAASLLLAVCGIGVFIRNRKTGKHQA